MPPPDRHIALLDAMVEGARKSDEEGFLHVATMGGSWLMNLGQPRTDIEASRETAEALRIDGLLGSRPNRKGEPIYFVTRAGYEDYDNRHRPRYLRLASSGVKWASEHMVPTLIAVATIGGFLLALWTALR